MAPDQNPMEQQVKKLKINVAVFFFLMLSRILCGVQVSGVIRDSIRFARV